MPRLSETDRVKECCRRVAEELKQILVLPPQVKFGMAFDAEPPEDGIDMVKITLDARVIKDNSVPELAENIFQAIQRGRREADA